MKLTKCEQGHFYDGEKYPACPYCNTDLQADTAIVRTRTAAAPAETGTPEGPVTGWMVVLDGAEGPVTLNPDAPLGARMATVVYDEAVSLFTLLPGSSQQLCYLAGEAVLEPQPLLAGQELKLGASTLRFVPLCGSAFHW